MASATGNSLANGWKTEEFLNQLMDQDNIANDWFLVGSPIPVVATLLIYLGALKVGIRWMENRQPYQITIVMRVYNIFQIFFNIFLVLSIAFNPKAFWIVLKKSCTTDISGEEMSKLRYAYLFYTWGFLLSKMIDLLDTVFMVLRKKNSHITFLHVYHHVAMVFFTWFTLKYIKSLQSVLPGIINSGVHVVMYSYYFLATFGPSVERYLWWKHHLTKLQLAQFAIIMIYISVLYYNDCPISRAFTFIWLFNIFVFFCLFLNFYVRAYIIRGEAEEKHQKTS